MKISIDKKNKALKHLGRTTMDKKKFVFSKLGNELTLITTKICNLNCSYCYDKANLSDKVATKKALNKELTSNEIIKLVKTCKNLGVNTIRLTGGEALLKKGFFDILKECEDMYVSLCSNGLILKSNLEKIVEIHPENKLHIHLSLDGLESHKKYRIGSDPFEIISLIRYIKDKYPQIHISVNTVLTNDNTIELCKMYELLKDSGLNRWTVSFPRLVENALETNFKLAKVNLLTYEFKKFLKKFYEDGKPINFTLSYFYKHEMFNKNEFKIPQLDINKHPCLPDANGANGLIVDSFGNILDCLVLKPLLKAPINLKKSLSKEIFDSEILIDKLFKSLNSEFYDFTIENKTACLDCRYLRICKGGCPANAFYLLDDFNATDVTSCLMFYNFETEILPLLDSEDRKQFDILIDTEKSINQIKKKIDKNKEALIKIGCFN